MKTYVFVQKPLSQTYNKDFHSIPSSKRHTKVLNRKMAAEAVPGCCGKGGHFCGNGSVRRPELSAATVWVALLLLSAAPIVLDSRATPLAPPLLSRYLHLLQWYRCCWSSGAGRVRQRSPCGCGPGTGEGQRRHCPRPPAGLFAASANTHVKLHL